MFTELLNLFTLIEDTRNKSGLRYDLPHFLLYCILAVLSGCTSYASIQVFMAINHDILKDYFQTRWWKVPSVGGVYNIINTLDTKSLENAFQSYFLKKASQINKKDSLGNPKLNLALDGKALRGTFEDGKIKQLVSVFETYSELILAHIETTNKESEILAVRELLELIQVPYLSLTFDALHTQKNY
jgi:hypothetical protein